MSNVFTFGFERLDVYQLSVQVHRWALSQTFPQGRAHIKDQCVRSLDSLVLNIAEGCGQRPGAARLNHYRIALGSAAEAAAVLDIVQLPEAEARKAELRRVGAMLFRMANPRD